MRHCWTEPERLRLLRLRDVERLKWSAVAAAMPGRSLPACQLEYYAGLRARNGAKKRGPGRYGPGQRSDSYLVPPPAPAVPHAAPAAAAPLAAASPRAPVSEPSARRLSTHVLIADAELRARIAAQGLTAGLLGDPPAGRSALDERRNGTSEAAAVVDRRSVRLGPQVTLATAPLDLSAADHE